MTYPRNTIGGGPPLVPKQIVYAQACITYGVQDSLYLTEITFPIQAKNDHLVQKGSCIVTMWLPNQVYQLIKSHWDSMQPNWHNHYQASKLINLPWAWGVSNLETS